MLPDSSLPLSFTSAIVLGSKPRLQGVTWITQISSGLMRPISRSVGFWRNKASQNAPSSTCAALNRAAPRWQREGRRR
jgi:hypothetical protein